MLSGSVRISLGFSARDGYRSTIRLFGLLLV